VIIATTRLGRTGLRCSDTTGAREAVVGVWCWDESEARELCEGASTALATVRV